MNLSTKNHRTGEVLAEINRLFPADQNEALSLRYTTDEGQLVIGHSGSSSLLIERVVATQDYEGSFDMQVVTSYVTDRTYEAIGIVARYLEDHDRLTYQSYAETKSPDHPFPLIDTDDIPF